VKVELVAAKDWNSINSDAWDLLANESIYPNPFYERWCLGSAINNLSRGLELYIACGYVDGALQVLCPVVMNKPYPMIEQVEVWRHPHCSLSSPLVKSSKSLPIFLNKLLNISNRHFLRISNHLSKRDVDVREKNHIVDQHQRAAQILSSSWGEYLANHLADKQKKYFKIVDRIENKLNAQYYNIIDGDLISWLRRYVQVESSGWKFRAGTSLAQNSDELNYYLECIEHGQSDNKIEFQAITTTSHDVAISFRFITHNQCFEIKTSYHEDYKQYSPGVALEFHNLKMLFESDYDYVDSCTDEDNQLLNKLWQHKRELISATIFQTSVKGRFLYQGIKYASSLKGLTKTIPRIKK